MSKAFVTAALQKAARAGRASAIAEKLLSEATEVLMPLAYQQVEIIKKVTTALYVDDSSVYQPYFRYDWIELNLDYDRLIPPIITCTLWCRGFTDGRGFSDIPDSAEASFTLSEFILDGDPEKFELQLRAKLAGIAEIKRQQKLSDAQWEIQQLEDRLARLKGEI
jgi:hypothetical protein